MNWDVSQVRDMEYMFTYCSAFNQTLNWDVSNVMSMELMFYACRLFNNGGVPMNWDVSHVKVMRNMFVGCDRFDVVMHCASWLLQNPKIIKLNAFTPQQLKRLLNAAPKSMMMVLPMVSLANKRRQDEQSSASYNHQISAADIENALYNGVDFNDFNEYVGGVRRQTNKNMKSKYNVKTRNATKKRKKLTTTN